MVNGEVRVLGMVACLALMGGVACKDMATGSAAKETSSASARSGAASDGIDAGVLHHVGFTVPSARYAETATIFQSLGCQRANEVTAAQLAGAPDQFFADVHGASRGARLQAIQFMNCGRTQIEIYDWSGNTAAAIAENINDVGGFHIGLAVPKLASKDEVEKQLQALGVKGVQVLGFPPPSPGAPVYIHLKTAWGLRIELFQDPAALASKP